MTQPHIIDAQAVRVDGPNDPDKLIFRRFQDIPDSYLQSLRDQADSQKHQHGKDLRKIASIPEVIVNEWKSKGFDINKATAQEIVARLQREDLGSFIVGTP